MEKRVVAFTMFYISITTDTNRLQEEFRSIEQLWGLQNSGNLAPKW